jgi:hypothetical protein
MAILAGGDPIAITSATTTSVKAAPASGGKRRVGVGMLGIRNKGAADNTITIIVDRSATDYEQFEFTLSAEQEWTNSGTYAREWILEDTDKIEITTSSTSAIDGWCSHAGD